MMGMDDDEMGPDDEAISAILDLLESKSDEKMHEKYGPKPPAVGSGHVVTVTVHAPGKPGDKAEGSDDEKKEDESGLTSEMLEKLMGE